MINRHDWRLGAARNVAGINHDDSLGTREPNPPVQRTTSGIFLGAFISGLHRVLALIYGAMHAFGLAVRDRIQFALTDTEDSAVRIHPEISKLVRNNCVNEIFMQPLLLVDHLQSAILEARDSQVLR